MKQYVGKFDINDLTNKVDKVKVAEAQNTHPQLKYVLTKEVKKNKQVVALEIWVCDIETFKKEG